MRRALVALLILGGLSVARAAIPTTTVNGKVYMPGGAVAAGGTITATLSQAGTVADDTGSPTYRVGGSKSGTIASDGTVTGLVLIPNDLITPAGTIYKVTLSVTSPISTSWTEYWSVANSPDPVGIGDVSRVNVSAPPQPGYIFRIKDESTVLGQQGTLRMNGSGVSCVNDGVNTEIVCTFTGGGSGDMTQAVYDSGADGTVNRSDTATALATNGANCPAGQAALGVSAAGAAEGCFAPMLPADYDPGVDGAVDIAEFASLAAALNANGSNAPAGSVCAGVDAAGNCEGALDPLLPAEADTLAEVNALIGDADLVSIGGVETITGRKNFTGKVRIGDTAAPTDQLEVIGSMQATDSTASPTWYHKIASDGTRTHLMPSTFTEQWNIAASQIFQFRYDATGTMWSFWPATAGGTTTRFGIQGQAASYNPSGTDLFNVEGNTRIGANTTADACQTFDTSAGDGVICYRRATQVFDITQNGVTISLPAAATSTLPYFTTAPTAYSWVYAEGGGSYRLIGDTNATVDSGTGVTSLTGLTTTNANATGGTWDVTEISAPWLSALPAVPNRPGRLLFLTTAPAGQQFYYSRDTGSDGTADEWRQLAAGGITLSGPNTACVYNNNGAAGLDDGCTFDSATDTLTTKGPIVGGSNVADGSRGAKFIQNTINPGNPATTELDMQAKGNVFRKLRNGGTAGGYLIADSENEAAGSDVKCSETGDTCDWQIQPSAVGSSEIADGSVADVDATAAFTRDTEWDSIAEINAASTDYDVPGLNQNNTFSGNNTWSGQNSVTGSINGTRLFICGGRATATTADTYLGVGGNMSSTMGMRMMRAGSITGISVQLDVTAQTTPGTIDFNIQKAASTVFATTVTTSGVAAYGNSATQARNTDTFAANDLIQFHLDLNTFVGTVTGVIACMEFIYD